MTGITAAGTGSGIDVESLVTQLMAAEKTPLTKLATKAAALQSKISLIGQFTSLVSSLQTSATNLQNLGKLSGIKATVGNTSAVSVTATSKATSGSYSLNVTQLAAAQQIVSKSATDGGFTAKDQVLVAAASGATTAKISISFGSVVTDSGTGLKSFDVGDDEDSVKEISLDVDADGVTLQDVANAINAGDYGVKASLISDQAGSVRLSLTGNETGAENAFKIDVSYLDAADVEMNPVSPQLLSSLAFDPSQSSDFFDVPDGGVAIDSIISLNGVAITRASNTIDDAVEGLTFDLKTTTSTATTLTVARDSSTIATQLTAFVSAYNQIASTISSTTGYDAETKVAGALQGDATIRSLQNQLRSFMTSAFGDGTNSTKTLSALGISFQKNGTLALDSSKLSTAVTNDLDGVIEFLGAFDQSVSTVAPSASKDGFAYKLEQLTKGILADNGLIDARLDGLNRSVDDIEDRYERVEMRMDQIEKRYRAQFTAMDTAVASLQNLSGYITQLLNMTSDSSSS